VILGGKIVIKFSDKMNLLTGSEIRELLKLTEKPDIISFAGGLPAPELFPIEELKRIAVCVMEESGKQALQYSTTEGFLPLRKHIAERMLAKNKIKTDPSHILMTSGSQMGLDFSARVFLNKDDIVLLESPSYLGAINAFKASEAKFIEVPTDKEGMIISELEKNLGKEERVKMIYVIPDFQNPSGRTWSLERRQKFMEIVNKYEIPVIEDNPYGELRFEKEILPALKALDTKGLVVYLGTFSKVLVPGYRLGWVCASAEKLEKYNFIEQASSLQASTISQMEVSKYMDLYNLDDHIAKIKEVYRKRRDIMLKTMDEEFPEGVEYTRPEGGLFTWVILPEYINARNMALECIEKKVAYVPGGSFFPNGGHENTFRMNYSCMPEEKIIEGIQRIAEVIKKNMK